MKKILCILLISTINLAKATTVNITTSGLSFSPNAVTVNSGDVLSFTAPNGSFHNIDWLTAPTGALPADYVPILNTTPVTFTLTTPGTYTYQCGIHTTLMQGTIIVTSALPIKLKIFDISETTNGFRLNWITSNEIDVSNFLLERSTNDLYFENIASIKAKGNSSEEIEYFFQDTNIPSNTNFLYYRLKIVDLNGNFDRSPIIGIKPMSKNDISVYPNPTSDIIMFEGGNHDFHHNINEITVFNSQGKIVIGPQNMGSAESKDMYDLDVRKLVSGKYIAIINNKIGNKKNIQFIVNH